MTAQQIVDLLNEAYKADPAAMNALLCNRVPTNQAMMDHPTIVVQSIGVDCHFPAVGLLGILNGIAGIDGEIIEAVFSEPDEYDLVYLTGFRLRNKETKE